MFTLQVIVQPAFAGEAPKGAKQIPAPPFSTESERCIVPASEYHGVNYHVLRAILVAESSLRSQIVTKNTNGTIDVGIAGINSINFTELKKYGIAPEQLLDACVSTYTAAWLLRRHIEKHGNTWEAVARYHSGNPYENQIYQVLLKNELVRSGAMTGSVMPVPRRQSTSVASQSAAFKPSILITDTP